MKKQKNLSVHVILKKENNKLKIFNPVTRIEYDSFLDLLEEGQYVDAFFDANKDDGTLAQLAKIHACIKELANQTGDTFEDMKIEIKERSGLCVTKDRGGEIYKICKSFSKCSSEELSLVINAIIEVGDIVGVNCR